MAPPDHLVAAPMNRLKLLAIIIVILLLLPYIQGVRL